MQQIQWEGISAVVKAGPKGGGDPDIGTVVAKREDRRVEQHHQVGAIVENSKGKHQQPITNSEDNAAIEGEHRVEGGLLLGPSRNQFPPCQIPVPRGKTAGRGKGQTGPSWCLDAGYQHQGGSVVARMRKVAINYWTTGIARAAIAQNYKRYERQAQRRQPDKPVQNKRYCEIPEWPAMAAS